MKNINIIPAVEIVGAIASGLDVFIDEVNSADGLVAYTINSQILITSENTESDEVLSELLEDNAFNLGLETTFVKLMYLNLDTNEIVESKSAIAEFKREYLTDLADLDEIPLSASTELVEFIHEYEESIHEEINQIYDEKTNSQPHDNYVAAPSNSFEDDFEFEDNVNFDDSKDEESDSTTNSLETEDVNLTRQLEDAFSQTLDSEPEENEPKVNETKPPVKIHYKERIVIPRDQNESQKKREEPISSEESLEDRLLVEAKSIFFNNVSDGLPTFDEITHRELQQEVMQANFELERAKNESIRSIYKHLQQESQLLRDDLEQQVLEPAKQRHEATIEKLNRNKEIAISRLKDEKESQYQTDRERYVQAQLPVIRNKFDSEHLKEHNEALEASVEAINEDTRKSISIEQEEFDKYVQNVLEKQQEELFSNLSFEKELSNYKDALDKQKSFLIDQAERFDSQVKEAIKEQERIASQITEKNKQLEEKFEIQKSTENQRIEAKAAEIASKKTREIDEVNLKWRNENGKLQEELKKALKANETLSDSLSQSNIRLKYLETQNKVNVIDPSVQSDNNMQLVDSEKTKTRVPSWLTATLAVLVTVVLLMTAYLFVGRAEGETQSQQVTTQTSVNSKNSSTSDSQIEESLHVGDEIPYTTRDGKKVTVIVDDSNGGHYVAKDGSYKSVIFAK